MVRERELRELKLTARIMMSRLSVLALRKDSKNPDLYYSLVNQR